MIRYWRLRLTVIKQHLTKLLDSLISDAFGRVDTVDMEFHVPKVFGGLASGLVPMSLGLIVLISLDKLGIRSVHLESRSAFSACSLAE